jgi:hypothetical protein
MLRHARPLFLLLALSLAPIVHSSIACDFSLPQFSLSASLSKSTYYPPVFTASAISRYLWTCRYPNESRDDAFTVHLRAKAEVAGSLALAFQDNVSLRTEVILADALDTSDIEWAVDARVVLSDILENFASLPTLHLKFSARRCGCVKRVRFTWVSSNAEDSGVCDAPISVQPDFGSSGSACFPSWAFQNAPEAEPHSTTEGGNMHILPHFPPSNPCHPDHSKNLPLPDNALRAASFNGHCK